MGAGRAGGQISTTAREYATTLIYG